MSHFTFLSIMALVFMNMMLLKNHIFAAILWLEVLTVMFIFILLTSVSVKPMMIMGVALFLLGLVVTEASVALATMVVLSRDDSNMMLKNMNINKC